MTEATQVNDAIRKNLGPLGRFLRMEHAFDVGVPDWYYRLRDASGWIEAKLVTRSGRRPDHLTLDQVLWGEQEAHHGGTWFLLALREPRTWLMYDPPRVREWFDGRANRPILEIDGRFPTREIALTLAPRRRPNVGELNGSR